MSLDFRFPLGRPSSPVCRWCKLPRVLYQRCMSAPRVLICRTCDVPCQPTTTSSSTTTEESQ